MFEGIQRSLGEAFKKLRGRGSLTEANVREGLQEVRKALLDADVNYTVADEFVNRVTQRAIGQEVLRTIDPKEQIIRIIYDELVHLMGPVDPSFHFAKEGPTVIMLCGLQGSGKTTTAGKLALNLREMNRKPLLVAADMQRPAAIEQLKILGQQINVPVSAKRRPPTRSMSAAAPSITPRTSSLTRSSSTPPAVCTSTRCRWTSCGRSTGSPSRARSTWCATP